MRIRAMAQLADAWKDTAERAIEILDSLDPDNASMSEPPRTAAESCTLTSVCASADLHALTQPPPPTNVHGTPHSQRNSRILDMTSPEGSVIAPSHSASQVAARRAGHTTGYADDGSDDEDGTMLRSNKMGRQGTEPIPEEVDERGGSSDEEGGDDGLDPKRYQVHVNKPPTPAELAAQKRGGPVANGVVTNGIQPAPTQQIQPRAPAPGTLTDAAGAGGLSNGIRKRVASAPAPAAVPQQQQAQQPIEVQPTRSGRETAEERQKRFSTLTAGSNVAQDYPTAAAPAIALPSASSFTIDAHKKRTAPEATLFLPSGNQRTSSYRATSADSDDEEDAQVRAEQRDEVRSLDKERRRTSSFGGFGKKSHARKASDDSDSVLGGRRVLSKRANVPAYQGSDVGESARGGSRHEKSRSEGNKSSGGLFGSIGSLFKKRDVGSIGKYGEDEDGSPRGKRGWSTRTDTNISKNAGGGSTLGYGSSGKKKKAVRQDDSDSDAPDPKTLVRVVNNNAHRGPNRVSAFSDVGVPRSGTVASRNLSSYNNDSTWVPPPERERLRAMSDVGAPRSTSGTVKRKSTTTTTAGAGGLERKSSVKSTATTATAATGATGTGTVKKKKKVTSSTGVAGSAPAATLAPQVGLTTSSRQSSYDASALVNNVAAMQNRGGINANRTLAQNPAQRVTRDTPSLMSVVAPAPQTATTNMGMHMPSAKNPGLSRSNSMASQTYLGTLPPPSSGASNVGAASSVVGTADAPLKKKKTVKKSSTSGNVAGAGNAAPASTLTASATTPTLLGGPPSAVAKPKAPASILSDGSTIGRRKSVRLASDTRLNEARYDNAGAPANIGPQQQSTAAAAGGQNGNANFNQEWGTRIGRDGDVSSDEEGDEYAKIRAQLNRSERDWKGAGFLDKGKGRAAVQ